MSDEEAPPDKAGADAENRPEDTAGQVVPEPYRPDDEARATGRGRSVLAWAGVAGWGAWAALRLAGGDRLPGIGPLGAPLLALTPYVAAAAPVPLAVALLLRRRRAAAAAAVIMVSLLVAVVPRAIGDDQPAARGPAVRVLTANVFFSEVGADDLVALVRRTRPDVLSLQELTTEGARRYERAGLTNLLPHKFLDTRTGAAGSGLYSRFPLRGLPPLAGMRMATPQAEFTLPGGRRVEVTAVHPTPPIASPAYDAWRHDIAALPSARAAAAPLAGSAAPVRILAGDFNATLDHATLRNLIGRGYADAADRTGDGLVPTWGAGGAGPPITIDHVLFDRRGAVTAYAVHDLAGSDHRALLAEIRLP
ncbi:endonuclease/exonuclease/phosphatase family protein [Spirillospora sp. NPDC029432]|uniref:endonuclease/exonuclease/phosphatase family protein n=1 Tax=Spirillospora sp. NPDC029432 TaxID=3154599 RepID=UPI00345624D8